MKIPAGLDDNLIYLIGEVQNLTYKELVSKFRSQGHGVTVEQFSILVLLKYTNGIRQQDIADALRRDKTTITRVLSNMQKNGLLLRSKDADDARTNRIYLTEKGTKIQKEMVKVSGEVYMKAMRICPDEDVDIAIKTLRRIIINLE